MIYHLQLDPEDNVAILRYQIFKETQVKSERQKILNLKGKDGSYGSEYGDGIYKFEAFNL